MSCGTLKEVELPNGLLEIGEGAFSQCTSLKRMSIPSITVIPANAFMYCRKLEEVELCEGLQTIGNGAFNRCRALKRIVIPSTVTIIGSFAFHACCQLEEVELSEGRLEIIGQDAFTSCSA